LSSSETRGDDFTEETLLANLTLESPRDTNSSAAGPLASPTDEAKLLRQSESDLEGTLMATSSPAPDVSLDTSILERPKRLSGAARKKRKKLKERLEKCMAKPSV